MEATGQRAPLGLIWERLTSGDQQLAAKPKSLSVAEALSIAAIGSISSIAQPGEVTQRNEQTQHLCLVIPNELSEARQQDLLDALSVGGREVSLLWRPIAAAFNWLELHASGLGRAVETETSLGSLLCIHLGVDGFEACCLELILGADSGTWVLPARKRPRAKLNWPAGGRVLLESLLAFAWTEGGERERALGKWRAMWASPVIRGLCYGESVERVGESWGVPERISSLLKSRLGSSAHWLRSGEAREWSAKIANVVPDTGQLAGVVVTGELASLPVEGISLGEALVRERFPAPSVPIEVEGSGVLARGCLARAAARYSARRAADLPTYLDTLPAIETLITRDAEPVWESLLQADEQYVPGGRPWVKEPRVGPLYISRGEKKLSLLVWLGSEDTVRSVEASFTVPPAERVEVELDIRMEPARGAARVEVVPKVPEALGRKGVLLDWLSAVPSGKSKGEHLASYERVCPALQPRKAWASRGAWGDLWSTPRLILGRILPRVRTGQDLAHPSEALRRDLEALRAALRQRPPVAETGLGEEGIASYGVTSSEGTLSLRNHGDSSLLDEFSERAIQAVLAGECSRLSRGNMLACLGYICGDSKEHRTLIEALLARNEQPTQDECIFIGGCARSADHIRVFAKKILDADTIIVEYRVKALAQALQLREEASGALVGELADDLAWHCFEVVSRGIDANHASWGGHEPALRFKYVERSNLVLMAFLLRTRIYEHDFMDPDSKLGTSCLQALNSGLKACKDQRLFPINGMVHGEELMRRVRDYINRRGSGLISGD
ncbi:MAG: hypothetical protein H6831_00510 [Planctomycetes bacterium]|nr:hypothetical protein [Planctomycetota bacterium]